MNGLPVEYVVQKIIQKTQVTICTSLIKGKNKPKSNKCDSNNDELNLSADIISAPNCSIDRVR